MVMRESSVSSVSVSALRQAIAGLARQRPAETAPRAVLGHAALDAVLGGGLMAGRLHEVFANDAADASSAAGFALMLALRLTAGRRGTILWLRAEEAEARGGRLHMPGLAGLGGDPGEVILGVLPDALALLRAAAEAVRCPALAVVVLEMWRSPRALDLTASRRLAVAAEQSGVTALLVRADAAPTPSAAWTRWGIAAAASTPLEANAPGVTTVDVTLLRQRAGAAGGRWRVEWDRERLCFRPPPVSGHVVPLPAGRSAAAGGGVRWRRAG
jgi:protein ImuA